MSMQSALRGPAHQLAVRMRINNCTHGYNINNYYPINWPAMHHAPATARAPRVCTLVPFIFLRKSDCLGCAVLLCLVCLLDLACFFLPSFSSLIKTCISICITCTCTCIYLPFSYNHQFAPVPKKTVLFQVSMVMMVIGHAAHTSTAIKLLYQAGFHTGGWEPGISHILVLYT